ncbi:hypothetical protein RRG08_057793 [Elysia crispata]|uniref:Uncharacterized protein n=1 Tax=Elysia crispata TaxID=231223 RepID=A0AAE0Z3Y3_9GAST|nr:hypothetical protein RRG08_057793 [Elysia crispata]
MLDLDPTPLAAREMIDFRSVLRAGANSWLAKLELRAHQETKEFAPRAQRKTPVYLLVRWGEGKRGEENGEGGEGEEEPMRFGNMWYGKELNPSFVMSRLSHHLVEQVLILRSWRWNGGRDSPRLMAWTKYVLSRSDQEPGTTLGTSDPMIGSS